MFSKETYVVYKRMCFPISSAFWSCPTHSIPTSKAKEIISRNTGVYWSAATIYLQKSLANISKMQFMQLSNSGNLRSQKLLKNYFCMINFHTVQVSMKFFTNKKLATHPWIYSSGNVYITHVSFNTEYSLT